MSTLPPSGEVAAKPTIGDKNAKRNVVVIYCPLPSLSATPSPKVTAKLLDLFLFIK